MVPTRDPRGSRTALLIGEYSLYLAALPLLTTAGGLTGSMFALEGVAANGYLLYLAHRWGGGGCSRLALFSFFFVARAPLSLSHSSLSHLPRLPPLLLLDPLPPPPSQVQGGPVHSQRPQG